MKRILIIIFVLLFAVSLSGCNQNKSSEVDEDKDTPRDEAGITGYVMAMENGRILVVNPDAQDFSATGGVKEFYNAIWFSNVPQDIKLGERVNVWYDLVMESYPGQSEVKHIEVIPSEKPEGVNLTEAEALSKALTSQEINANEITVVKDIAYNNKTNKWNINLKQIWSDEIYNIQVEDK